MFADQVAFRILLRFWRCALVLGTLLVLAGLSAGQTLAQGRLQSANGLLWKNMQMPANAPAWLSQSWHSLLQAPQPNAFNITPGVPLIIPQLEYDADATGRLGLWQPAGPTFAGTNAFFQSLGTNGRACVTCHEPNNAFGLSLSSIRLRYQTSFGFDPLFAPVDGATCPKNVPANQTLGAMIGGRLGQGSSIAAVSPYATLLNKGLIRIPLPVPKNAQFTVTVASDPYGCNTDPNYAFITNSDGSTSQLLSVYRRPIMSAGMNFKVRSAANAGLTPAVDALTGAPLPLDAQGNIENGNLMWDGREPTLTSQALDATLTHAQAITPPTSAQLAQMVQFETGVYSAQASDNLAGVLNFLSATGGPVALSGDATGTSTLLTNTPAMTLYNSFNFLFASPQQASIYRGQQLFSNRSFNLSNVAGINNLPGVPAVAAVKCGSCHNQTNVGAEGLPVSQFDLGIGGDSSAFGGPAPAPDLPIFLLTCLNGTKTPYHGSQVLINDPGKALITGQCSDIGRLTTPNLRGLAGRAPYFSDGSAANLLAVVNFYNSRFQIGFSAQDEVDLVNFLSAL